MKKKNEPRQVLPEQTPGLELFRLSPNPVAFLEDGKYLDCNNAMLDLYGVDSRDDIRGQLLGDRFSPDRQPDGQDSMASIRDHYQKCLEDGVHAFEWVSIRTNGELIYSNIEFRRLDDFDPPVIALFFKDVSAQFQARQELERSEKRFQALAANAPVGIFIGDNQGNCIYANPKMKELCGLPGEGMLGRGWTEQLHPNDKARVLAKWKAFTTHSKPFSMGVRFVHGNGQDVWTSTSAVPFLPEADGSERFLGTATDITELILIERKLEQSRNEAEKANQAKSEFLSHMSHELRTPLNAILGFGQLLQLNSADLTEDQNEAVGHILAGGEHLLGLIEDVLDLSRIESGKLALTMGPVDTHKLLSRTVAMIQSLADQHGVTIQLPDEAVPDVMADPHRLQQVLVNLLSNAIKYNHKNGQVFISCEDTSDGQLRIHVKDTGRGIPAKFHSRLFKPFERFQAENEDIEGTGIGLGLSQLLMQKMGSQIEFESEPGRGSDFWIELSRARSINQPTSGELDVAREVVRLIPTGLRVLYIDGHHGNIRHLMGVSRQLNCCELITAGNNIEGMNLAASLKPDLVLMDIEAGKPDGFEAARMLKNNSQTRDIPIIAVTSDPGQNSKMDFLNEYFAGYVSKPLEITELLNMIAKTSVAHRVEDASK